MSWPQVNIDQKNQLQGETKEIERAVLYIGTGKVNAGKTLAVNTQTDFDVLLGTDASTVKSCVNAAMLNAGQNWNGFVHVIAEPAKNAEIDPLAWVSAVRAAQLVASVEGVVVVLPADKATITAAASLRAELLAKFGRWVWFVLAVDGPQVEEGWPEYLVRLAALQQGVAASSVQLVPRLWGNEPGVLAGRLCSRAVTVADSPARVATGPLLEMGSDAQPVDGKGVALDLATLQALETLRYSVPMWYPDYDGMYWADGRTLDVEGGDYQVIEYLRIVDKAARRIRLQAIAKIADRALNSTPGSIAAHKTYFSKVLREMARSTQINGITFPGEVKPPKEGDVVITWRTATKVEIYIVVRPYECPKSITVSLMLDTALEDSQ
ncbi:DUF2586 domain-containing protein [Yersinia pseudotuberculosis]|uniref:Putative phage protein n=1 Tax=Yersinia pseudotuberculosis serotype O:3 (strain YPIII) TaxID=502800 RepID=A0A0H3B1A8_YERPY|nr:DUF2586 domain-containing protein [Yersinia pseudotuberculosis]AJJ59484.1 hypothetical protein BZ22_1480 [Yersinia pseudotuberculosis YPIII]AYW86963.1 DUF2586 domain-containing protein [Yersinia pseudotuberculosis]AYX16888.1 DUF2586 domain-containing protein [Yersinia pseudotuberculosis]MBK1425966.1 DUF2586 family protein [Yersinia pseudotuberculosis]MCF1165160.1 DUF2586 domain-containing protein [Yersinia pseudotuberculosis]